MQPPAANKPKRLMILRAIAVLLAVAAFLAGALAFFLYERHARFLRGAVATEGVVVDREVQRTEDDGRVYFAIVEFRDPEGEAHRFRSRRGGSFSDWTIGERFTVLYRPEKPSRAELRHEQPGAIGAIGLFALLCLTAAAALWFFRRPRASAGTGSRTG